MGVDQLLAVRLAQSLGEAPIKARGENPNIPNQWPVALALPRPFLMTLMCSCGRTAGTYQAVHVADA